MCTVQKALPQDSETQRTREHLRVDEASAGAGEHVVVDGAAATPARLPSASRRHETSANQRPSARAVDVIEAITKAEREERCGHAGANGAAHAAAFDGQSDTMPIVALTRTVPARTTLEQRTTHLVIAKSSARWERNVAADVELAEGFSAAEVTEQIGMRIDPHRRRSIETPRPSRRQHQQDGNENGRHFSAGGKRKSSS